MLKAVKFISCASIVSLAFSGHLFAQQLCDRVQFAYDSHDCGTSSANINCNRLEPFYSEYYLPENDDSISVQASQLDPVGDWTEFTDSSVPGGIGFRWDGPNLFNSPGSGRIGFKKYLFAGTYRVALSLRKTLPDSTEGNDVFLAVPGASYILNNGSTIPAVPFKVFLGGSTINQVGFGTLEIAHLDHHQLRIEVPTSGVYEFLVDGRSTDTEFFGIRTSPDDYQQPYNATLLCSEFSG